MKPYVIDLTCGVVESHPVRVRGLKRRPLFVLSERLLRRTPCGCVG